MSLASTSASAMEGGAGGVINWNPSGGSVWILEGKKNDSAAANLGHELFHGRDANRGLLDGRSYRGLKYDEWQMQMQIISRSGRDGFLNIGNHKILDYETLFENCFDLFFIYSL